MTRHLGIAAVQMEYKAWDADATISELEEVVGQMSKAHPWIDLFIAPELALSGLVHFTRVSPDQLEDAVTTIPGPRVDRIRKLAKKTATWIVPGSFWEREDDKVYNATVVVSPEGEIVTRYRKMFPWLPYENGITGGNEFITFDIPDVGRIGVTICYDTWFPEVSRTLAWMGADVILRPTLTPTSDRDIEIGLSRANAAFNQVYFIDVNGLGPWGGGRSAFFDPNGRVLQESGTSPTVLTEILDLEKVRETRERGTLGLCQTWKQLRDTNPALEMYRDLPSGEIFQDLGDLALVRSLRES